MRYLNKPRLTSLMMGLALFAGGTHSAFALGTASGDPVNNTATVDYLVGTEPQTAIDSNLVTFQVDNKVDLAVALTSDATVTPGADDQVLVFTLTNEGNTNQAYALAATPTAGADDFDADTGTNPVRIYIDNDSSGTVTAGDTLYVAGSTVVDLTATLVTAASDSVQILVVSDMPLTATDGQTAIYDLTATTLTAGSAALADTVVASGANTDGVEIVFADAQGTTDGATPDAIHSAAGTYTVNSAALTIAKTADVDDGIGGVFAIPGATVSYTILVTNNGAEASTVVISDPIPTNTTYVLNSLAAVGGTVEYSVSTVAPLVWTTAQPAVAANVTNVRATFATLADGSTTATTATMTFDATIN